jgi:serine/threonine-protein kinase
MAPERMLDPRLIDKRSDLYGIGCIGFYLLTGRKPFEATRDSDLAQQVLHVEAPLASTFSPLPVPAALDRLLACLAKDMARRPPDAAALIAALDEVALLVPWHRAQARLWWTSVAPAAGR